MEKDKYLKQNYMHKKLRLFSTLIYIIFYIQLIPSALVTFPRLGSNTTLKGSQFP